MFFSKTSFFSTVHTFLLNICTLNSEQIGFKRGCTYVLSSGIIFCQINKNHNYVVDSVDGLKSTQKTLKDIKKI